jgi:hypothetical protein
VSKKASEWQTYRCKFLLQAKQLTRQRSFVDALGREHRGKKGDYLVVSPNGAQRIWPRELFEDAHVLMSSAVSPASAARAKTFLVPSAYQHPPKKTPAGVPAASHFGKNTVRGGIQAGISSRYNM